MKSAPGLWAWKYTLGGFAVADLWYQGADAGSFTAELEDDEIVMKAAGGPGGDQRVTFYEIAPDSFRWKSEYSRDEGKTWITVMRMHATRLKG